MSHTCHAYRCTKQIKPEMFMCFRHWRRVHRAMQAAIWKHYRVGQCDDKNITVGYAEAVKNAIKAVAHSEGLTIPDGDPCLRLYDECIGDAQNPSFVAQVQQRLLP